MPLLKIQTNTRVPAEKRDLLLKNISRAVAQELGKPEAYMMVSLDAEQPLVFAGSVDLAAFMELKAIGLPTAKTAQLSALLCDLAESELGIPKDRVYINFTDVPANLWGWNSETF
jgi:phenylpyruvate tautomerase